ncbi:MAG TPA: alanine dehydrogenase [Flavobacteriales bacterium]|jgi:alanine dehydrogenase|nr:alanine dehydrogenase [Flavobacteriales bacterium]
MSEDSIQKSLSKQASYMPKEQLLEVAKKDKHLFIGIPTEISFQENRVALTPEGVSVLVNNGHDIRIERGAGLAAGFEDHQYSDAGAEIVDDPELIYQAQIVLKVEPPSLEEIAMMSERQILISALQLTIQPEDFLKKLIGKRITAVAWDYLRGSDGGYPLVTAMGEIAGNTAVLIAAEYLSKLGNGKSAMLGGIPGVKPSKVVIIGAGSVGEYSTRAALGLGATVEVFDNDIHKLRRLQNNIGQRLHTSIIQESSLMRALKDADVAIGAVRAPHGRTPCMVSEEMVMNMRKGAIVIDVSIDQGGCFETSEITNHEHPVFDKHGVIHYCVPNINSRVPFTASYALSNIFVPILLEMGRVAGVDELVKSHNGFRNGVYLYRGILTNEFLGSAYGIPYKDLDLLISAI